MQLIDLYKLNTRLVILAAVFGGLWPAFAGAVSIMECERPNGQRFFSERCPPGSKSVGEKKIRTGGGDTFDLNRLKEQHPVVMYLVDACDACDLVRNYLDKRGVPHTKKDVGADNPKHQEELKERSGRLTVPVVIVGETVVNGYNRAALSSALDAAGYPDAQAQQGGATDDDAADTE